MTLPRPPCQWKLGTRVGDIWRLTGPKRITSKDYQHRGVALFACHPYPESCTPFLTSVTPATTFTVLGHAWTYVNLLLMLNTTCNADSHWFFFQIANIWGGL